MDTPRTAEFALIGRSVIIKGELSGSEDLYIDGQVEGNIEMRGNNLTVGPNGQVRANVNAKGVVIQGKLEGNIQASERAELKKSAITVGDILTQRVAIEEGAYFKGKIEIQKQGAKAEGQPAAKVEVKSTPAAVASGASAAGGTSTSVATSAGTKTPVT